MSFAPRFVVLTRCVRKLEIVVELDGKAALSRVNTAGRPLIVPSSVIRRPFWSASRQVLGRPFAKFILTSVASSDDLEDLYTGK